MTAAANPDVLVKLNINNGSPTLRGPIFTGHVYGMVSSYGTLFAVSSNATTGTLVTVNPQSGAGAQVSGTGPVEIVGGMASPPNEI